MRRGLPLIAVLLAVMLLVSSGAVFAAKAKAPEQAAPAPVVSVFDQNTEVYYEARYEWFNTKNLITDSFLRLQKIEMLESVFKMFTEQTGISLENDIFSWVGNTVRAGIVGDDKTSVLHEGMEYMFTKAKARGELVATVSNMKNIGTALEMYSTDYDGKYPDKLSKLAPNYLKTIPTPARGGEFRYWVNKKKTAFIIKPPVDMFKDLGITGDKLLYSWKEGVSGNYPTDNGEKFKFYGYMFAIDVRDMEKAVPAMAKIEKILNGKMAGKDEAFPTETQGKYVFHNGTLFCYSFIANQLVIADSAATLKKAVASAENPGKTIYTGKVFQRFMKSCPQAAKYNEIYFINLEKIDIEPKYFHDHTKKLAMHYHGDGLCSCPNDGQPEEKDYAALDQTIRGLSYIAGYTSWGEGDITGEFQLHFKPDANIGVMKKYFAAAANENKLMETLPSGLPLAAVYNISEIASFIKALGQEIPMLGTSLEEVKKEAAAALGMDPEKDLLDSTTGEVGITYMLRDVFVGTIISTVNEIQSFKNPAAQPQPTSKARKAMKELNKFPLTFFFTVKDQAKVAKALDVLKTKMTFTEEKYKDVTIYKSSELVYCITGDKLIFHTYPSTVKVKEFIDGFAPNAPRMGDTTKYRQFRQSINGRPVMIIMQDAEWAMTLAKGFYLLFLPEFADYASYLQNYKESWSSLSITPDGFNYTYRLFKK